MIQLSTSEKIRILLKRRDMTVTELAEQLGTTRQNLTNKLTRDNFTESDLIHIASALDCNFKATFVMNDTKEEI